MSRSFLTLLHFDGTEFLGWQRQAKGRTVQGEVERVLARLAGRHVAANAAGRTDAGVHALGLAVSFAMPESWTADALRRALNALLPRDIWVAALHEMRAGFHARKHADSRRYHYDVGCDDASNSPFRRRYEWSLNRPLDGAVLQDAAALLPGEHDFRAFSAKTEPKPHYVCRISDARWEERPAGRGWRFHVEADRFLQHMVRMLVGTMVDLGLGRRPLGDMQRLMTRTDNSETSPPAPPHGLYFVRAAYPQALYATPLVLALLLGACAPKDESAAPPKESVTLATFGALQRPEQVQRGIDQSRRTAIVTAAARVSPAVVSVGVRARRQTRQSPWDFFFVPEGQDQLVQGYGTGFIVRSDGVVITNQHVVEDAESITVTLNDGTELPAKLVGQDATTDIAVLRIERTRLPVAPLGRSTDLLIGEWVVAMGNPYRFLMSNIEPTVTAGVVSAVGRNILPTSGQPGLYLDMIQTDAAINPGNSGGPLANALGQVVGVNSSIFTNTGGSVGLGFAIPIERVMRVAQEILERGEMHRAWTGLEVAGARQMQLPRNQGGGLRVESVAPSSPAAIAGFKSGDVLVSANGRPLRTWLDWEAVKLDVAVGDTVQVEVRSGSGTIRRRIRTGELPSATAERVTVIKDFELVTMTPAIRAERRIAADRGVLIYRITDQAERVTGLQEGDVILAINNTRVESVNEVSEAFDRLRQARGFRVFFERNGRILFTDLSVT